MHLLLPSFNDSEPLMTVNPYFFEGSSGRLFVLERQPDQPTCVVIFVQPFAEEMNKSRHMLTQASLALVNQGAMTVCFDHYATGDSEGAGIDASWTTWRKDLTDLSSSLSARFSLPQYWVCLRTGALIAFSALSGMPAEVDIRLVLWNPVVNGKQYINQFFRLRLAGDMLVSGGKKVTTADIRDELEQGSTEIAGYRLSSSWVEEAESSGLDAACLAGLSGRKVAWIETSPKEAPSLLPVSTQVINTLQSAGCHVNGWPVSGDQFWATQEITLAPDLISATCKWVAQN